MRNETVERIVNLLFQDVEMTDEVQALYDETMSNCQERYQDMTSRGLSDDDAIAAVVESLKGMEDVISQYPKKSEAPEAEEAPIRPLPENDGREEIPASGYTNQDARDFADEFGGNETVMAAQTVDYGKLVNNIDDWVFGVGGMNKQKNWTGFKKYKGSRTGDFLRTIAGKGMSRKQSPPN